jgi:hypothetical protein
MEWETALSALVIGSDKIEFKEHRKKNKKFKEEKKCNILKCNIIHQRNFPFKRKRSSGEETYNCSYI